MSDLVLSAVSSAELAEAADANFVVHASWVHQHLPGMRVSDELGCVLVDSGLACDTFNIVCRTRFTVEQALERIQAAIDFFREVNRPFSWWVGPGDQPSNLGTLLVGAGLPRADTELAMAADLANLHSYDIPDDLEIRRVRTSAELQDFAHLIADADGQRFYQQAAPVLLDSASPLWLYVGYVQGQPVATAEATVGGGIVGLYNISTLESFRRRGIGTALTLQPLLDARERGFRTATLQAAAAGVSIYARIGFTPFGDISEYKPQASSTDDAIAMKEGV